FVVVDFEPDPRVLLILGRCFLKTGRALIDVHKGELTLRVRNEAITYNLDQTSRDILLLEAILNSKPLLPLPNHKQYMPSYKKELKVCEAKTVKSSIDEPPEVELRTYLPISSTHFWKATTSCPSLLPKS
nr:reverse transcriptase domain-containing protein [Tanacetum cinerariifolium]